MKAWWSGFDWSWMTRLLPWWRIVLLYWVWETGWFFVTMYTIFHVGAIGQDRAFFLILIGASMIAIGYFVVIWVALRRAR